MKHSQVKHKPKAPAQKARGQYQQLSSGDRRVGERRMEKAALRTSAYLNSIIDPMNCPGAKIPDEITAPSFTAQAVTKYLLTGVYNATATTCGVGISVVVGSTSPTNSSKYRLITPTGATAGNYITVAGTGTNTPGQQIASIASNARPVSAGLFVQCYGAANTMQGRILIGFVPPNDPLEAALSSAGQNVPASTLANTTYVAEVAATRAYARAVWVPIDPIARSYLVSASDTFSGASNVGSGARKGVNATVCTYGQMFALVDGMDNAAPYNVEFTLVENYELLPLNQQTNIVQASSSQSDPLELAAASNVIASVPRLPVAQVPKETATGSPVIGMRPISTNHPSFMDKIMGGLGKALEVGKVVAPAAAQIMAML